jgi:hypothetical protein
MSTKQKCPLDSGHLRPVDILMFALPGILSQKVYSFSDRNQDKFDMSGTARMLQKM